MPTPKHRYTEEPLLERRASSNLDELIGGDGDYLPARGLKSWWRVLCIESLKLWAIGCPIGFQILCHYAINSVAIIFVGHLGDVELSAFSIAISVVGTFAFGFMLGMGSALETLCGQAFGAGKIDMLSVYMQRSMLVLFASSLLISPLYVFAAPVLKFIGQPHEIAQLSGFYTLLIIPQLFSLCVAFPTQKFLQAQSRVGVLAWIAGFCLAAQALLCWLFVDVFGLGAPGAALALDLSSWMTVAAQFVYVVGWCGDSWGGFTWGAFHEIGAFVRLSLASAVMMCLEIWYVMSIVVLAGNLDDAVTSVGSLSICMNIDGWETMVFVGVNAAISVRVSNELGSGHPRAAKYSVYATLLQSLLIGVVCMAVVLSTRNHFATIFTDSPVMQRAVSQLSGLLAITMLLNSIQPVISGVAIGGGWQALVAYINLGCYYIFGLPLGYILGYIYNLGVKGIWSGMIAGLALQTVLLLILLNKTNWSKEVEQTMERMRKWGGQL